MLHELANALWMDDGKFPFWMQFPAGKRCHRTKSNDAAPVACHVSIIIGFGLVCLGNSFLTPELQKNCRVEFCAILCLTMEPSFQSHEICGSAIFGPWNVESRHCPRRLDTQSFAPLGGWPCRHWIQVHRGGGDLQRCFCFDVTYATPQRWRCKWIWFYCMTWFNDTWNVADTL